MRKLTLLFISLTIILTSGCGSLLGEQFGKPIPTEMIPTVIALTLEARGVDISITAASTITANEPEALTTPLSTSPKTQIETDTNTPFTDDDITPTHTSKTATNTLEASTTDQSQGPASSRTPLAVTGIPGQATDTPAPFIPDAKVQIYWLGELSKVTAPIQIHARLTSQTGKIARVELYGEDGRLLARQVKTFYTIPWQVAGIDMELDFEIRTAAEMGRLVISVEDIHGRQVDLNSVNLVLLSSGETILNQASALWQRIYIKQPIHKGLIQGGVLTVSGLARPDNDQPLQVSIIDEDGHVLGQRLTGVGPAAPGGYGAFAVEVPYDVSELTPVLVTVSEDGGIISNLSHLASVQVLLSP